MSEPRWRAEDGYLLEDDDARAHSPFFALVLAEDLNRLDAAEALIAEMREALVAMVNATSPDEYEGASWMADAAAAKAEAWEASRAD